MSESRQNSSLIFKRRVWRFAACLLLFYLIADVTVLEYFCGNPNLGITSFRQIVKVSPQPEKSIGTVFAQNIADDSRSSKHDQEPEIPIDGDDCFCCSSHAVINYNGLIVTLTPVIHQHYAPNFSNRQSHSNWHLLPSYRPPRIA